MKLTEEEIIGKLNVHLVKNIEDAIMVQRIKRIREMERILRSEDVKESNVLINEEGNLIEKGKILILMINRRIGILW